MKSTFEILDWDSQFFGFKVAKIKSNALIEENQEELLSKMSKKGIKLGYYFSPVPLPSKMDSEYFDINLVDKKVPLVKPLAEYKRNPKVREYTKRDAEDKLIELAQLAGIHTRFNKDPNIPKEKYEELFRVWVEKSVSKEMATDVLVYMEENEIVGFTTIQLQKKGPYVSLLAVQKEHEGKGVSVALMNAIENILVSRRHTHVYGATQMDNRKAMVVYQRYGLRPQSVEYVYHLWKK